MEAADEAFNRLIGVRLLLIDFDDSLEHDADNLRLLAQAAVAPHLERSVFRDGKPPAHGDFELLAFCPHIKPSNVSGHDSGSGCWQHTWTSLPARLCFDVTHQKRFS